MYFESRFKRLAGFQKGLGFICLYHEEAERKPITHLDYLYHLKLPLCPFVLSKQYNPPFVKNNSSLTFLYSNDKSEQRNVVRGISYAWPSSRPFGSK